MQVFWLLTIINFGISAAQDQQNPAGSQLQGAAVQAAARVPPQVIPEEPANMPVAVTALNAIPAPVAAAPTEELCRSYVKSVHMVYVQSVLTHLDMKATLINNLRSEIGDGFYYAFRTLFEQDKSGLLKTERDDFNTKSQAYTGSGGLTQPTGTAFYGSSDALVAAMPAAHDVYDKRHINMLLYLKEAWGKQQAYGNILMLMSFDLKLFADRLTLAYNMISEAVKLLAVPGDKDAERTTILDAFTATRAAFEYTSDSTHDAQKLSLAFVKYLDAMKKHKDAFVNVKTIVDLVNTRCVATMPTEHDAAAVKADVDSAQTTKDYLTLTPKRESSQPTTAESSFKTAAYFRYVYAMAFMRMSTACNNQVMFLASNAPSADVEEFTNMYNTLQRDIVAYIDAMSPYMLDLPNSQLKTNHDTAATNMVQTATSFITKYMETVKKIMPLLDESTKAASEGEIVRTDAEILRIAVVFLGRMVRLYKMDVVETPNGMDPAAYSTLTAMMDTNATIAEATKAYVVSKAAAPDDRDAVMRHIMTLKDRTNQAFDVVSKSELSKTLYPQGAGGSELQTKVFSDLKIMLDALACKLISTDQEPTKDNKTTKTSGFVIPSALLAAGSALIMI